MVSEWFLKAVLGSVVERRETVEAEGGKASKRLPIKIDFAFSHILRKAASTKRQVQFAEKIHVAFDPEHTAISRMQLMAALDTYFRDLEIHAGYYKYKTKGSTKTTSEDTLQRA